MGGYRVSVQLSRSHVRRLLSCPPSFFQRFFLTVWAALELLCYVVRDHHCANRFAIILSHVRLYFPLHFPSCDQKGNLSYAL